MKSLSLLSYSLVQVAIETQKKESSATGRQRRASESDTWLERNGATEGATAAGSGASGVTDSGAGTLHGSVMVTQRGNVDIMQMLSKAQDEYDKVRLQVAGVRWSREWEVRMSQLV